MARERKPKVDEAAASLAQLDVEAAEKATKRDTDGRYIPRYPGIRCPKLDATFDRHAFVGELRDAIKEGKWATWARVADHLDITTEQAVHRFEQLCWFGLTRKATIIEGRGDVAGVVIATPDGSWVVDAIRWQRRAD